MQDVAIFWDYVSIVENCSPPSNASGYSVANNIRLVAQAYGSIKSLKAYMEITDQVSSPRALAMRSEFQASGISLIDCPHNGRKEVADKMIIVDMLAYAIDNPAPSVIVLISGDRDFAYALSILRLRHYQVILVTLSNAHPSLTSQASECFDWHSNIICPVAQPPSKPTSDPIETSRTLSHQDSARGRSSSSSQSSQSAEETESNAGRADHGDLLHYLCASIQFPGRRLSLPHDNTNVGQQNRPRYERPLQLDASVPIEAESVQAYDRPSSYPSNLDSVSTSARLRDRNIPLAPEVKASTIESPDMQSSFLLSNTEPDAQPFLTHFPKIDDCPPTILIPSITPPERPQYLAQQTAVDTTNDDASWTNGTLFIYPARPALTSHSSDSPSPQVSQMPVVEPPEMALASTISKSPRVELQSIPLKNSGALETPATPLSGLAEVQSLPDTSIDLPGGIQNTISASPSIDIANKPSYPVADSNEHDQTPAAMVPINQGNNPTGGSPKAFVEHLCPAYQFETASTVTVNPTRVSHSSTSTSSMTEVVVPPMFTILVDILKTEKTRGYTHPLRTWVADAMYKSGFTYESVGLSKFSQYTALAEKQGIVELGTHKSEAWIALKPAKYLNAPASPPAAPAVPSIFKILVDALKVQRSKGVQRSLRSNIAIAINRGGLTYREAGVERWGPYAALAEKQGIIELGGREGDAWISLKPEYYYSDSTT